jgi:hypothetical protein
MKHFDDLPIGSTFTIPGDIRIRAKINHGWMFTDTGESYELQSPTHNLYLPVTEVTHGLGEKRIIQLCEDGTEKIVNIEDLEPGMQVKVYRYDGSRATCPYCDRNIFIAVSYPNAGFFTDMECIGKN